MWGKSRRGPEGGGLDRCNKLPSFPFSLFHGSSPTARLRLMAKAYAYLSESDKKKEGERERGKY